MMFYILLYILGFTACDNTPPPTELVKQEDGTVKYVVNTEGWDSLSIEPDENGSNGIKPIKGAPDDDAIQRIAFYNVENLFDTKDEPVKKDEEFTPAGRNKWDNEKYKLKLRHLAKVIDFMGQPGILGLCEVENPTVLKDLIKDKYLVDKPYGIVHQESPDIRGIDVALLFDKNQYELVKKDFIRINFPKEVVEDYTTRDVLHATLKNKDKEFIHVFVNHWPSRRGGEEASEPKRTYVAKMVKAEVNKIFNEYKNNHVVLIGDFNDEPFDKSVNEVLGAKPVQGKIKKENLYDLMSNLKKKGMATYNYKGKWNLLDHIVVSGSLLDGKKTDVENPKIFNRDWMLYYHRKTQQFRPSRTFNHGKYYAGYSDHLPVCVDIVRK